MKTKSIEGWRGVQEICIRLYPSDQYILFQLCGKVNGIVSDYLVRSLPNITHFGRTVNKAVDSFSLLHLLLYFSFLLICIAYFIFVQGRQEENRPKRRKYIESDALINQCIARTIHRICSSSIHGVQVKLEKSLKIFTSKLQGICPFHSFLTFSLTCPQHTYVRS